MFGIFTKLIVVIFCAVLCDCGDTCENDSCKAFKLNKNNLNKRMIGNGILEVAVNGIHDCARQCFYFKVCKSFNFDKKEQPSCKLNNVTGGSAEAMFETKAGAIFSDITEWPCNMAGKCGLRLCSVTQRCLPVKDSFKCIDIKCGSIGPIPNGVTTLDNPGHMDHLDTASVSCDEGYQTSKISIQCQATGAWESSTCELKECPDSNGMIQLEENFRLKIYKDTKKHNDAVATCEDELDGNLVVLDEEWKMSAVSNILSSCPDYESVTHYWTDGKCSYNGNYQCHFTSGKNMPMNQGTMWLAGSPDDEASACVRVQCIGGVCRWGDRSKYVKNAFICEY